MLARNPPSKHFSGALSLRSSVKATVTSTATELLQNRFDPVVRATSVLFGARVQPGVFKGRLVFMNDATDGMRKLFRTTSYGCIRMIWKQVFINKVGTPWQPVNKQTGRGEKKQAPPRFFHSCCDSTSVLQENPRFCTFKLEQTRFDLQIFKH